MERDEGTPELPVEITDKLSHTPLENASWHKDVEEGSTTPPTITQVEKATEAELKNSKVEDDTSGGKGICIQISSVRYGTN